jgi:peptidoglycan-associated lipoprotein
MQKKLWIILAMVFVIPGLLFTASCAKKAVKEDTSMSQQAQDEAAKAAAEKARQEELARQRAIEEARLKEEAIQKAKDNFLNEDIHFEFDSAVLTQDAQEILKTKAEWLQNNPNVKSTVEGHCDERGTLEYNLALGERRASSAKSFLVDLGIPASRLITISYGEERPVDPGQNEAAWAKNRRAHFTIN